MPESLDRVDRSILRVLQSNATLSTVELADAVGISQSPCWRRLQRLKKEGYIRDQVTLLDRTKVGLNVQIFALIKLSAHGRANVAKFTQAVKGYPEVLECHITLGTIDCMLRIVTTTMQAYEKFFFEKLSSLPGVQEVNSVVSLAENKYTTAVPLD
jgi:Lrp/AsnC family transcriptional regulator